MSDSEDEKKDEELTINDGAVKLKYQTAANIANEVLKLLCTETKVGKNPVELCELGDKTILEKTQAVFNKKDKTPEPISRGIAFPTCINVNEVACHNSPLPENQVPLKAGDIIKIDLGVHIDGFAVVGAHTIVLQEEETPIDGRIADLVQAAQLMMDVAARCLKPGKKNNDITALWEKIATAYGVTICEGVLSHQMKRYILDGNQCIISKSSIERRVDDVTFASGQVWALDVVLSSGKGKLQERDARCCVFKRNPDQQYMLKLKASKEALREISTRFQTFPFSIRALDPKSGRLGISECLKHDLVVPYPVLEEKPGDDLVHFKRTVFVTKNSTTFVTGFEPTQKFASEKKCEDPEVVEVLGESLESKKKPRKRPSGAKKKGADGDEGEATAEGEASK